MTKEEFVKLAKEKARKYHNIDFGKIVFITMMEVNPDAAKKYANTAIDPYYNDKAINEFVDVCLFCNNNLEEDIEKLTEEVMDLDFELNKQNTISEAMDCFNFDKVHKVMAYLDWQWEGIGVPSVMELKKQARKMLNEAAKNAFNLYWKSDEDTTNWFVSTGGFKAEASFSEEDGFNVNLIFELETSGY